MATNKQLKFFKGANAPAAPAAGMIWFCTTDRTIRVYTGTEWEKYSGLVNAEWVAADKKLNITSANGTVTTLDLSDCASASDISAKLTTINSTLTAHDTRITTAQSAAEAAQAAAEAADAKAVQEASDRASEITRVEGLISAEATTARAAEQANAKAASDAAALGQKGIDNAAAAAAAVETEKGRAEGVEKGLDDRLKLVEGAVGDGGSVSDAINAAIEALATPEAGVKGDGTHVDVTVKQVDGVITEVVVDESDIASAQALTDEIGRATAAEQGLNSAINGVSEKVTKLIGDDTDMSARAIVQDEVAKQLTSENISESFDTLKEMAEWLSSHPADVKEITDDIAALEGLVGSTSVQAQITAAIEGLSDDAKSSDGTKLVQVTVNQANGNVTGVSLDDSKLSEAITGINGKISANTAAHEANAAAIKTINETTIPGINGRLDDIDEALESLATSEVVNGINTRLQTAEGEIDTLQAAIERLDGEQDTQDQAISAADAKGAQGISDAAAALAEAQKKVASVTGDADVNASGTTAVTLSLNKATTVTEGDTKAVTSGAVFDALCWVEFE